VLAALERATGEAPPPPVAAHTTDWTNDPDARGAYSFWPAGAGDADVNDLAAPVDGRLFFAGEATSVEYQGSMAGALLSGARAAAEVLDAARGERALEHLRI
jgi:monoamine oxidase